MAACRNRHSTLFFRMNTLIEKLSIVRASGNYLNFLKRLSTVDLIVLDDFGLKPLLPQQYQDLYDILDERIETKSTIVTTQLPEENWGEVIEDPVTLANSLSWRKGVSYSRFHWFECLTSTVKNSA